MCFDSRMAVVLACVMTVTCTPYLRVRQIRSGAVSVGISVPEDKKEEPEDMGLIVDSIRRELPDGPVLMNAIRDSETGEMVATDVICASTVTARFRNVAERGGYVSIGFDVSVPAEMSLSRWKLELLPKMTLPDGTVDMEPVYITGRAYRERQLRGYQRYRRFLESIVADSSDFVRKRQLEIFVQRNFPLVYAMKNDTSYVSDEEAESLFGVSRAQAQEHYTRHLLKRRNDWKKSNKDLMFSRFVKDPIVREGIRLDTVLLSGKDFIYRYVHTFRSVPGLKKVAVCIEGGMYENGELIAQLPLSEGLTFYISSLSSLADSRPKYIMRILERTLYDRTKALIDFRQGSCVIDTTLGDNASELKRIRRCIDDVVGHEELVLDSLVVSASCSPEGAYKLNGTLASRRSDAMYRYVYEYVPDSWKECLRVSSVPENWDLLRLLVCNDTVMAPSGVDRILSLTEDLSRPDVVERKLAGLPEYRYMREKIYPRLRSVSFDFYLHRAGMVKDTMHTTEPDTLYQAGVDALKNMDYPRAVSILRPYCDYNSALAFVSAGYDHSALDVLGRLDENDPRVCYLKALVLLRLGQPSQASKYYRLAVLYDPSMEYRANLDPEMSALRE